MQLITKTLIICFLYSRFTKSENIKNFGEIIKNLMNVIDSPQQLTTLICWDSDFKYFFTKSFTTFTEEYPRDFALSIGKNDLNYFPYSFNEHHQTVLMDLNCDNNSKILSQVDHQLRHNYKWIFMNSASNSLQDEYFETFKNLPILPNSNIYYVHYVDDDSFLVKQVYRISMEKPLIFEDFGLFSNKTFIDQRQECSSVARRRNLDGLQLQASMVVTNNDTLNHLTDYKNKHIDTITKVNYFLTNNLMEFVNATVLYSIINTWGYKDKDTNEYNGMIGELVRKKADIGATPCFFTVDRVSIIEYIAMPSETGSRFIFRSPKLSYTTNLFLLPFNTLLWICLIALIIVTGIFLLIATIAEWRIPLTKDIDKTDSSILQPNIGDVFLLVYTAACQQGSNVEPKSVTARIISFVVFLTLMFLYNSYSANIVALLQSPSNQIKTLKNLYDSRLAFGVDDTVFNRYYFSHATEPVRKAIYEQKVLRKDGSANFLEINEGVKKLRQGLYAFHMEPGVGYKIISETFYENEKCGLQEIKYLEVISPWYAIQKNSSYKELLKIGMMRIHEFGLQTRENSRLYTKKPVCSGNEGHFITASLIDIRPAIELLAFGLTIGILTLMVEIFIYRFCKKKPRLPKKYNQKLHKVKSFRKKY